MGALAWCRRGRRSPASLRRHPYRSIRGRGPRHGLRLGAQELVECGGQPLGVVGDLVERDQPQHELLVQARGDVDIDDLGVFGLSHAAALGLGQTAHGLRDLLRHLGRSERGLGVDAGAVVTVLVPGSQARRDLLLDQAIALELLELLEGPPGHDAGRPCALVGVVAVLVPEQAESLEQRAHAQALDEQGQTDDAEHHRHEEGAPGEAGGQGEHQDHRQRAA